MNIINKQREYFKSGETLDINFRLNKLRALKESILNNLNDLVAAFKADYNKCEFDVYSTEVGLVIKEINYFIKNLKKLAKGRNIATSLINIPSRGVVVKEPYGNVLIVAPWNYPFQLAMMPLVGAIAAGNTIYLKTSRNTTNINKVIKNILSVFEDKYIYVMENNKENKKNLFDLKFDYVFYTGSPNVARELMSRQAKYLTPMTLELGGKSPCIIDRDADIEKSAKRLVWGKFLNAGQTCVAPDYAIVHNSIKRDFIKYILKYINEFYYHNGQISGNFTAVINEENLNRLLSYIKGKRLICGGSTKNNVLEPTVIDEVSFDDKIMEEEIFGPILPVIEFSNLEEVINHLKNIDKPLALYYFGNSKKSKKRIIRDLSFGGGCINDTIMHLTEEKLPFGGVGLSGFGSYHGKKSYDTFSHQKSILKKSLKLELNLKYPPYNSNKLKLTKFYFGIKNKEKFSTFTKL